MNDSDFIYWAVKTIIYVLGSNTTISFFFQFETFLWVLMVVILFMASGLEFSREVGQIKNWRNMNKTHVELLG